MSEFNFARNYASKWTPEDEALLREIWNPNPDKMPEIVHKLGRTSEAIRCKAARINLPTQYRQYSYRDRWDEDELDFLKEKLGSGSLKQITTSLNRWRKKRGRRERSPDAVKRVIRKQGWSLRSEHPDFLTISQIAYGLRCSKARAKRILSKEYEDILKPQPDPLSNQENPTIRINWLNFRELVLTYPGLFDGLQPDMPWLIGILKRRK